MRELPGIHRCFGAFVVALSWCGWCSDKVASCFVHLFNINIPSRGLCSSLAFYFKLSSKEIPNANVHVNNNCTWSTYYLSFNISCSIIHSYLFSVETWPKGIHIYTILVFKKKIYKNTHCFGNQKQWVYNNKELLSTQIPVRPHTARFKVVVVEQESSISDLLSTCQVNDLVPLLWLWSCILLLELYASKCSAVQHPKLLSLMGASVNFKKHNNYQSSISIVVQCKQTKKKKLIKKKKKNPDAAPDFTSARNINW